MLVRPVKALPFTILLFFFQRGKGGNSVEPLPVGSVAITFLVSVNDTMEMCLATAPTPQLFNGKPYNKTTPITIGSCENGKLTFAVNKDSSDHFSKMDVVVTFYTHKILAMPPTCSIPWNGTYLKLHTEDVGESPLPSCFVSDSQEGYHTMYYWFRLLEWKFLTLD